ncbi:MAG: TM0106 family RecB-like putative nuclease [Nitrospirae bacterium]|nr:TM0106 family RecB-like putative nuclease [Nitrospirota bacterium]
MSPQSISQALRGKHLLITGGSTAISTVNSSFKEIKKQNLSVAVGISISNDKHSLILDAAELASQSSPRKPVYNPIIFLPLQKISKQHKLLLAFYGSALGHEQKIEPASGRIILGDNLFSIKVHLASLIKTVGKIEKEITNMIDKQAAPPLRLNDHCKICEFQEICYAAAKEKDDLSLLKGLSGKEIDTLNKRGIFMVTQYSYTFRPRRAKKMASRQILKHYHSLNALAIRTQTIYIAGKPELPDATTRVYLDVEGIPDENFYYLIGLVIDDGESVSSHSFWANDKSGEKIIWGSFLEKMEALKKFVLFHYGSYESKFFKRMGAQYGGSSELIEKIISHSFNVLSAIYGHIYFPTYSNDLKSIASFLGFKWSDHNASGLTSLLWRQQWKVSDNDIFKQKLITYNYEDCLALRTVAGCLEGLSTTNNFEKYPTKHTDQIKRDKPYDIFSRNDFCFPELDKINRCAYFDYQREKVYLRENTTARKRLNKIRRRQQMSYKVNKEILFRPLKKCPHCHAIQLSKYGTTSKLLYDLKIISGGIKRWVVKYRSTRFLCKQCRRVSSSKAYTKLSAERYGRTLTAWAVYQNIGRLKSMRSIAEDFGEVFGYWFTSRIAFNFKMRAADYYRNTYKSLLKKITRGGIVHIDETKANLKEGTGYIWVFANSEEAVYVYSATREGKILEAVLNGYDGVVISDFYAAYDSLPCRQQKCLIHLIRDINENISKNPFDVEMKGLGRDFTMLLVPIIKTIDKFGLRKRHLNKHKVEVRRFFDKIELINYSSEFAKGFQERFVKYKDKLFTFLDYNGVPWNNNNAEHAVKRFVFLRRVIGGSSTVKGIQEYLVLLSICETLRLKNVSFLQFLLSGATDIDDYMESQGNKAA